MSNYEKLDTKEKLDDTAGLAFKRNWTFPFFDIGKITQTFYLSETGTSQNMYQILSVPNS